MNQFKSLPEYENFVYTLSQQYPYILHLTKHIPPNIKHHRVPAPALSFTHPYITFLLHEIKTTLLQD